MTSVNMKSDLVDDCKYKIEGRQSLHRSKTSKIHQTHESDDRSDTELTLSSDTRGEFLHCSKRTEICSSGPMDINKLSHFSEGDVCTPNTTIVDEALVGKAAGEGHEADHLKGLLLLNLDLIQHQQELLSMKDRQLKLVRAENEALKCRLERMERRMSILKQKDRNSLDPSSPELNVSSHKAEITRGVKRKLDSVETPQKLSDNIQKRTKNGKVLPSSRRSQGGCGKDKDLRSCSSSEETKPIDKINLQKLLGSCDKKIVDDGLLRTDIMYYVPPYIDDTEEIAASITQDNQSRVEVPTWRLNPVSRYYNLEGTENLEDEVFLKRHQKPEIDERRRKRWDTQRLREQRIYEKLQNGPRYSENKSKQESQEQPTFSSFCPDIDEIDFIEVCETIPVCAFGFPIPNLKPTEFELPWFDLDKREYEEKIKAARKKR